MSEFMQKLLLVVAAFVFGAGGLAVLNVIQERWKIRYDHRVAKDNKNSEQDDKIGKLEKMFKDYTEEQKKFNSQALERFKEIDKNDEASRRAMKFVLLDRIIYIGQSYIKHGVVTFDERRRLREMHDTYHNDLGGNGDADNIMDAVDELPLTK